MEENRPLAKQGEAETPHTLPPSSLPTPSLPKDFWSAIGEWESDVRWYIQNVLHKRYCDLSESEKTDLLEKVKMWKRNDEIYIKRIAWLRNRDFEYQQIQRRIDMLKSLYPSNSS